MHDSPKPSRLLDLLHADQVSLSPLIAGGLVLALILWMHRLEVPAIRDEQDPAPVSVVAAAADPPVSLPQAAATGPAQAPAPESSSASKVTSPASPEAETPSPRWPVEEHSSRRRRGAMTSAEYHDLLATLYRNAEPFTLSFEEFARKMTGFTEEDRRAAADYLPGKRVQWVGHFRALDPDTRTVILTAGPDSPFTAGSAVALAIEGHWPPRLENLREGDRIGFSGLVLQQDPHYTYVAPTQIERLR